MSKETYTVDIDGIPTKICAASKTQALMAKEYIEKSMKGKPNLTPRAQRTRMKKALKEAQRRRENYGV